MHGTVVDMKTTEDRSAFRARTAFSIGATAGALVSLGAMLGVLLFCETEAGLHPSGWWAFLALVVATPFNAFCRLSGVSLAGTTTATAYLWWSLCAGLNAGLVGLLSVALAVLLGGRKPSSPDRGR